MKNNWSTKKLGEIIELHYGKGIASHDRKLNGKYPVYGANGELGRTDKFLVEGDALIIGRKGTAGEVTRVSGRFWPADVTYYVFGNEQINVDYLFYALKRLNLKRLATGIKPGINRNRVYELEIPLPPIAEQKRIVEKIEKFFAKIDEASRLRAESSAASAALLPSALHRLFNSESSWKKIKIGKVVRLQGGFAFKSTEYQSVGIPIVRIQNLKNEVLDLGGAKYMSPGRQKEFLDYLLHDGDLLIAMSGATTGKIAIVKNENLPALLNQRVGRFVIKDMTKIKNDFLFWVVRIIQQRVFKQAAGAAQPNISGKNIEEIEIPLPPIAEQKKIVAYLDSLSAKSRELQNLQAQTAADFSALRQSVLSKSFSG